MTLYPVPLDQRHAQTLQNMQGAIKTLQARTMGIDSGIPLMSLPGVIDSGYPGDGSNPKAYVNGSADLTGPYEYLASYFPVAGDTVTMLPVQQSYIILSSAGPATATRLPGTLEVDGNATFEGNATINGALTVDGNAAVVGALNVDGPMNAVDGLGVSNGNLTVASSSELACLGVANLENGCQVLNGFSADACTVTGATQLDGQLVVEGTLQVEGDTFLDAATKVTGTLEVTDHMFADNSINIGTCATFTEIPGVSGIPVNSIIVSGGTPSLLYFIDSSNTVHEIAFA